MNTDLVGSKFNAEQQELWQRVNDLWALSLTRDAEAIRSTLHPRYVGWDMNSPLPHDREFAVRSVTGDAPPVASYQLTPLSVEVYDHSVGVVHYRYAATVLPTNAAALEITGKWTEVYLRQERQWLMVGVSGRPDITDV